LPHILALWSHCETSASVSMLMHGISLCA